MSEKKTALQKLSWKISENVADIVGYRGMAHAYLSIEDIYTEVYQTMPADLEHDAQLQQEFENDMAKPPGPPKSSILKQLREALHCTDGMSLKTTIEAAIDAIRERDLYREKEQHGCMGMFCEACDR